jgi:TP901 family phage tail tape measure protein
VSGVSEVGIRISLEGGKEAAAQALEVADSLKKVADGAKVAGTESTTASGGVDKLSGSLGDLTEVTRMSGAEFQAWMVSNREAMDATELKMAQYDVMLDGMTKTTKADMASQGISWDILSHAAARDTSSLLVDFQKFGKGSAFALGVAGAAVVYETSKMAVAFDNTTSLISANADVSEKAAARITNSFKGMGQSGFDAQDIASAYAPVIGQLTKLNGVALNVGQSEKFMTAATMLATTTNEDLGSATESLAAIMQTYQLNVDQTAKVSNILFNASRLTATSTSSLAATVDHLHSRLGQVMPSLAQTSALMYDLTQHGANGAQSTRLVSSGLTVLLGRSAATDSMLEKLGLSVGSLVGPNGKFIGMANAIALVGPKLEGLTQSSQLLAERALFGAGAQQILGQTFIAGVGAYNKSYEAIVRHNAEQQAMEKISHSVNGQIKILDADFHNFGLTIGQFILPKLVDIFKWMDKNKIIVEILAGAIGFVMVAAIGAWIAETLTAIGTTLGLAGAATELGVSIGTCTLGLSLLIPLIIAGLVYAGTKWKTIWDGMKIAFDFVWEYLDKILHNDFVLALMGPIGPLIFLGEHWKTVWNAIKDVVRVAWNYLKPIFDGIKDGIGLVGKAISGVKGVIGGIGHMLGFAEGGVVPGPQGAPMLAMVHGGEVITPPQNIYNATNSAMSPLMLGQAVSHVAPGGANATTIQSQVIANGGGGSGSPTVIQLVVDRKVLAQTVYNETRDLYARR